jgi:hypothetical protein
MRKLSFVLVALAAIVLATPALAGGNNNNSPTTTSSAKALAEANATVGDVTATVGDVSATGGSVGDISAAGGSVGDISNYLETSQITEVDGRSSLGVNLDLGDRTYKAPDFGDMPGHVSDMAFIGACGAAGVSASLPGMGASLGKIHAACLVFEAANLAFTHGVTEGDVPLGEIYLKEGWNLLRRDRFYQKWLSWIPILGPQL